MTLANFIKTLQGENWKSVDFLVSFWNKKRKVQNLLVFQGKFPYSFHQKSNSFITDRQSVKSPLPPAFVAEIQTLFDRLWSKEFLASCEKGSTQNVNEAYHQLVWKLAPKEQYNSPWEISLAVEIATLLFNSGMQCTFKVVGDVVGVTVTQKNYDAVGWHWNERNNRKTLETKWETKKKQKQKKNNGI